MDIAFSLLHVKAAVNAIRTPEDTGETWRLSAEHGL